MVERLRAWLLALLAYGAEPNHYRVVSCSVPGGDCARVAERLRAALAGTPFQFVDPLPAPERLPHVVPFEYDATWPVEIKGRALTLVPPKPRAFEGVGRAAWVVDLLRDVRTGRAILDLHLPSSPVVPELLNGPCPPTFDHRVIPRAGDGSEAVNLICSGERGTVNLFLPTDEEVLEEILRDHGYQPVPDEKRSSYLPVIKRFGGLFLAGNAFAGQSGAILAALAGEPKTVEEIRGKCRLGDGKLEGPNYLQRVEQMLTRETERTRRISRRRFEHYSRRTTPEGVTLKALLEFWADRSVLTRHWKLGPCRRCRHTFFQPNLDLRRRVLCPGCGHRVGLPPAVPVGYSLHRGVRLAVEQGVMPVALTGRFLRNMTHRGFMWLPGVKYKRGAKRGDIDLLACCDGYLVFGECKRLDRTPPDAKVWAEVVDQFLRTAAVARDCGAHLAVLACQGSTYPPEVEKEIETRLAGTIPHLLLDKNDLEVGHREVREGTHKRWLHLADLIPREYPETPGPREGGPRVVNVGWGVHTSG
ncbi:MAG: hypothetical protein C0501_25225 [Isosphaera sp.]|nr:hypothetical protein [Isosphaera sp.]